MRYHHACDLACIVSMYLDVRPVLYLYYGICAMPPYYACVRNTNTETQTGTNAGPPPQPGRGPRVPPARARIISRFYSSDPGCVHAPAAYGIISHPAAPRKRTYLRIRT